MAGTGQAMCGSVSEEEVIFNMSLTGVEFWPFFLAGKQFLLLEPREELTHLFHVPRFEFLKCKYQVLETLKLRV